MVSRRVKENQTVGAKLLALESDIKKVSSQSAGSADSEVAEKVDRLERYLLGGDIEGGGGSSVYIDDSPPPSPSAGDLWFDSTDGKTYIYYNDGDSSQWVGLGGGNVGYPLGAVYAWPIETVPSWALELNGQAVSRTTYSGLFALLGTTYGVGDGSTTFNLPDYRGRTLVGQDTGQTEFDTLGEVGGAKTHTLTLDEAPPHSHKLGPSTADDNTPDVLMVQEGATKPFAGWRFEPVATDGGQRIMLTDTKGGGQPHNNLQPYRVVKWIICAATSAGEFDTEVQTALVTRVSDTPLSQNFILNGAFDVWQRGTTITHSANPDTQLESYTADRFRVGVVEDGVAWRSVTVTRSTNTIPGYLYSAKVTSNSATVNRASVRQLVEDGEKLIGQTLTFSAFIKRIATTNSGTEIRFRQGATQTVVVTDFNSLSTTEFTRVSYTFTAGSTNDFRWEIVRSGGPLLGTTGDLFEITGIQLELGNTATPFRRASSTLQGEIAACQRYYYRVTSGEDGDGFGMGLMTATTNAATMVPFPATMRVVPTLEASAASTFQVAAAANFTPSAISLGIAATRFSGFVNATVSGATAGQGALLRSSASGATTAYLGFNAEL